MINGSALLRASPDIPFMKKFQLLRSPDIYIFEDVQEYRERVRSLPCPWYKDVVEKCVFVALYNVGIRPISYEVPIDELDPDIDPKQWYAIHDASGLAFALWDANNRYYPAIESPEQAAHAQGLREDDFVFSVMLIHLIASDMCFVAKVEKRRTGPPARISAKEVAQSFFPGLLPQPT
jgi:hypothetical protein